MNIEDLTKSQLLLLTLLVNFVVSIATGIVTVSLLDQASPVIAQTVNRIVEHTVETVAPATTPTPSTPAKSQPTEEDQLVAAISAQNSRTVTIKQPAPGGGFTNFAQVGVFLPKSKMVATAANKDLPQEAAVTFSDGSTASISLAQEDDKLAIYTIAADAKLPQAAATSLLAPKDLKQGQAVIALTADGSAVTGIISKIDADGDITTTLPSVPAGASAVDLSGDIVGIAISPTTLASATDISALLASSTSAKP